MIQEDKILLLKDICTRLPYMPKIKITYQQQGIKGTDEGKVSCDFIEKIVNDLRNGVITEMQIYLRPMSSMTEEEKEDFYQNVLDMDIEDVRYENDGKLPLPYNQKDKFIWFENIYLDNAFAVIDWLNENHFDYRGLIEKGLAIAVTEENNLYKE